jgi:hypothetical protein
VGSSGKKRTTMSKLKRESRLRDKRDEKQARKAARKLPFRALTTPSAQPSGSSWRSRSAAGIAIRASAETRGRRAQARHLPH